MKPDEHAVALSSPPPTPARTVVSGDADELAEHLSAWDQTYEQLASGRFTGRLDELWHRFRAELPAVTRPPSEILREHIWITTQPADEPEEPRHLRDLFDWIGWDRVLFASDYPHWDFDDPRQAIPRRLGEARRRMILSGNGRAFYGT